MNSVVASSEGIAAVRTGTLLGGQRGSLPQRGGWSSARLPDAINWLDFCPCQTENLYTAGFLTWACYGRTRSRKSRESLYIVDSLAASGPCTPPPLEVQIRVYRAHGTPAAAERKKLDQGRTIRQSVNETRRLRPGCTGPTGRRRRSRRLTDRRYPHGDEARKPSRLYPARRLARRNGSWRSAAACYPDIATGRRGVPFKRDTASGRRGYFVGRRSGPRYSDCSSKPLAPSINKVPPPPDPPCAWK